MKSLTAKKWLLSFLSISLAAVIVLCCATYLIDPDFKFRAKDNSYILNVQYQSAGLVKNFDYDTLIIGSSMTQNFDMDVMREQLNCKPLHIGMGGMNLKETQEYIGLAQSAGKAKTYYICIDMFQFTNDEESGNIRYLINDSPLDFLRYSAAFETWFRFIPTDVLLTVAEKIGLPIPQSIRDNMSVDKLGQWKGTFSEETVINNYLSDQYGVSEVDNTDLYARMTGNIDGFFSANSFDGADYVFFFPPYSALYWYNAQKEGYIDDYIRAREYFLTQALKNGCTVLDFQTEDFTVDLNNYKDTTHFKPEINDWMVRCFAKNECVLGVENDAANNEKIYTNIALLIERYPEIEG